MNNEFSRVSFQHDIEINASKVQIFPLLCLVREGEWLPGFSSKTVYSASGISELDGVFVTDHTTSEERFWVVPVYEKNKFIELIYFTPGINIVIIKLLLEDESENRTKLHVEYIYTSISDSGNRELGTKTEENFKNQINQWRVALNYLFEKGKRIPESLLSLHH